ncbi:MAG TPA: hypothetical protein PLW19_07330, partial [Anaerolineaceae bacterium]|nr:hypothetical protein [Anaerolineaceae bacterium]
NAHVPEILSVSSSQLIKEIILPEIEKEVNEGKNFAPMRQIYQSLILAQWYKETIKESLLSKVYVDQNKIKGVDLSDPFIKDQIYAQYVEAMRFSPKEPVYFVSGSCLP